MPQQNEQVVQIALDDLVAGEGNRKVGGFDQKKLEQLAESIKAVGVQQPAVVRKQGVALKFEIVAGERRWRASKIAGLDTLPCVVRDLDDVTVLKIRTIENLQREDVHPLDEASGFSALLKNGVYDPEHLAQEMGKSLSYVYQRLKLLELIPPAREMLIKGKINAGHAILIARLRPELQKEIMGSWILKGDGEYGEGVSVRHLEQFIQENVMMDLSKAEFKKDDADLVTKAGPCTTCQKRTGFQPALFADVCKNDYCTDPDCFQAKLDALVKQRREISDVPLLLVQEGYGSEKRLPKGTLEHYQWTECKANDAGAVRCLVVDGVGRGRLTWGKEQKRSSGGGYQKTPQEKAAEQRKKTELELKRVVRRRIWDEVFRSLGKIGWKELDTDLLRIIVAQAWDRLWNDSKTTFAKTEGWEKPKKAANDYSNGREDQGMAIIAKLDRPGLMIFLTKITLIQTLDVNPQYGPQYAEKPLHEVAKILGLDPKVIELTVRKEAKAKAAKKPAAKAKSVKTAKKGMA